MPKLIFKSIEENRELVSSSVFELAQNLPDGLKPLVAEIDPQYMGGKELSEHYAVDPSEGANCIIVEARRGDKAEFAAILVPVGYRADLNSAVRKHLEARKVFLAPLEKVLEMTGMEYGSITPIGLPGDWKILIDSVLMEKEKIIVGGGKKISKILVPTELFRQLPNVEIVESLSRQGI